MTMDALPPGAEGPVLCIVGARPNYMKMAPLLRAFAAQPRLPRALLAFNPRLSKFRSGNV